MKYPILFFSFFLWFYCSSCSSNTRTNFSSDTPSEKTYAVIVGALEWSDPSLYSFEKKNRKDQELYELLKSGLVDENNMVFLMDDKATLKNIQQSMKDVLIKTTPGSHFIFYYAGHGMHKNGKYYFANYDIQLNNPSETGLDLDIIGNLISDNFNGKRVSLWADCCYSGGLVSIAENISKKGFNVCALTSATATNTSTGNWTYSQTIIDCLRGLPMMDRNNDGSITLNEMASEVKDAMKFRERQLNAYGTYGLDGDKTIISKVSGKTDRTVEELGNYVFALYGGQWQVARITGKINGEYECEFYWYSDKVTKRLPVDQTRQFHFVPFKTGTDVKIEFEKEWYDGTIVKSDGDFYYVTYKGYDSSYNEWVTYDRIRTGNERMVQVLWQGQYYDAEILDTKENKSYVHYIKYDYTWDEWTNNTNIK